MPLKDTEDGQALAQGQVCAYMLNSVCFHSCSPYSPYVSTSILGWDLTEEVLDFKEEKVEIKSEKEGNFLAKYRDYHIFWQNVAFYVFFGKI